MRPDAQPDLFAPARPADDNQAAFARQRMHAMIARLTAATEPFWRDEAAVILDDGAFQRAMRLVPPDEAQALWTEFDGHMERLYARWTVARTAIASGSS